MAWQPSEMQGTCVEAPEAHLGRGKGASRASSREGAEIQTGVPLATREDGKMISWAAGQEMLWTSLHDMIVLSFRLIGRGWTSGWHFPARVP